MLIIQLVIAHAAFLGDDQAARQPVPAPWVVEPAPGSGRLPVRWRGGPSFPLASRSQLEELRRKPPTGPWLARSEPTLGPPAELRDEDWRVPRSLEEFQELEDQGWEGVCTVDLYEAATWRQEARVLDFLETARPASRSFLIGLRADDPTLPGLLPAGLVYDIPPDRPIENPATATFGELWPHLAVVDASATTLNLFLQVEGLASQWGTAPKPWPTPEAMRMQVERDGPSEFGISVRAFGDHDGDGLEDVLVTAWQWFYPSTGSTTAACVLTRDREDGPLRLLKWRPRDRRD